VWSASLDVSPAHLFELRRILSDDEREKEKRLRFQRDQERYVVSEAVLRAILGRYLGASPAALRFVRGPHGKPALAPEFGPPVRFNMSHSRNLALYAVTLGREIGVDVEFVQNGLSKTPPGASQIDAMQIAQQFFSSYEVTSLQHLPQALRQRAFFHTWTRKEAYLKARGEGLTFPLNEFDVSVRPEDPAALLRVQQHPQEVERWVLRALEPAPSFVGTVVVETRLGASALARQTLARPSLDWQFWSWGAW
jgi:4'-phosphopantetheinyl transferase